MGIYEGAKKMVAHADLNFFGFTRSADSYDPGFSAGTVHLHVILNS